MSNVGGAWFMASLSDSPLIVSLAFFGIGTVARADVRERVEEHVRSRDRGSATTAHPYLASAAGR